MPDRANREKIDRLRSEIQDLMNATVIGDAWKPLYQEICTLLTQIYGIGSAELEDFQDIRFEIQEPKGHPFTFSLENHYRQRLSEADEYLLSLIL